MTYENLDVMILTYNRAQFLEIALKSLFSSTCNWNKTIIVNNASTDNTLQIIHDIERRYPDRHIEIITHEKNIGNTNNFKYSQKIASNEYTAVFHDDDAIHPEYIERAMTILSANPDAVLASGGANALYNVDENNWPILPNMYTLFPPEDNVFYQLICVRPNFCCSIYKTEIYRRTRYNPEKYGKLHDISFLMEIGRQGETAFLHGECVRWRQHVNSDSNSLSSGPFTEEVLKVLAYIHNSLEEYTCELPSFKRALHRILAQTLLFNFAFFLYTWSALSRFLTWDGFKEEMRTMKLFTPKEYRFFDVFIDRICNPMIKKKAIKYWTAFAKTYKFRITG